MNTHFCLVCSFQRANHDTAMAKRSAQVPPYINPERAAAQSQTVPPGTERRSLSWRLFQETERRSTTAASNAAANMRAAAKTSTRWKMLHHDVPLLNDS